MYRRCSRNKKLFDSSSSYLSSTFALFAYGPIRSLRFNLIRAISACKITAAIAVADCSFAKFFRLRVVSNSDDGDCGAREIHTRARAKFRGDATRRERRKLIFGAPFASHHLEISCVRVCISRAPQSPSPKLETTRSLSFYADHYYTLFL